MENRHSGNKGSLNKPGVVSVVRDGRFLSQARNVRVLQFCFHEIVVVFLKVQGKH